MVGAVFWKEKFTLKMVIGTIVLIIGTIWVALAKGNDSISQVSEYS